MSPTITSTSTPLQLFPSPSTSLPRKSSLKKPKTSNSIPAHSEFQGVAWQVTTTSPSTSRIRPAEDRVKHLVTGGASPVTSSVKVSNAGSPKRQLRTRRRSSAPSFELMQAASEPLIEEDQLSPLPINTSFIPSPPPRIRTPVARLRRPTAPEAISVPYGPEDVAPDADQLSPLPSKQFFRPTTPPKTEFPSSQSFRSGGSTLFRSNSDATGMSPASAISTPAMRSMFPQYDHSRSLAHQQYFPRISTVPPTLPPPQMSKSNASPAMPILSREDSGVALVVDFSGVPQANEFDILSIWHSSTSHLPPSGRKVQLQLSQPAGAETSLAIGQPNRPLYTMTTTTSAPSASSTGPIKTLTIQKTCPTTSMPTPVSSLALTSANAPAASTKIPTSTDAPALTTIFPHQAAISAISAIASTPAAHEIAMYDPMGTSPSAARLARDAVQNAHAQYFCTLIRTTRRRDSFGAVTASYSLQHPSLGGLPITVTRARNGRERDPRAKICLHHPSATTAAVAAENLVLLELDFGRERCVLDLPGLGALDEPWVLDTVVSAVFAVAVMENDAVVKETLTFAPPPKTPVGVVKAKGKAERESVQGKGKWSHGKRKPAKVEKEVGLVRGGLAVLSLSLRGAIWLVGKGVKVTARGVREAAR